MPFKKTQCITVSFSSWLYTIWLRQEDPASLDNCWKSCKLLTKASYKTSVSFQCCIMHFYSVQSKKKNSFYILGIFHCWKQLSCNERDLCETKVKNHVTSWPTCVSSFSSENPTSVTAPLPVPFPPPFVLHTNPSRVHPLDNAIITTKLRAIKCRLCCNSEPGALVCTPSWRYLIHP